MKGIKIWVLGGAAGSLVGILLFTVTLILSVDGSLTLPEFGIALFIPAIIAVVLAKLTHSNMTVLLIVVYLTLLIPVLGPLFGAPNQGFEVAASLSLFGLIGGLVWSTPFAVWGLLRRGKAADE